MHSGRYDINKLDTIMKMLINEEVLPISNYDHPLKGRLSEYRECHVEPDWLLMYQIMNTDIIFVRTGSHSELFK